MPPSNDPEVTPASDGEPVHTISDYFDMPREGVADFNGKPHVFQCQFSDADDDWTELFWLMEIDQDLFELAKEKWAIFLRWSAEFKAGNVPIDTHPVLPADRQRNEELKTAIGDRLKVRAERSVTRRGWFGHGKVRWSIP